MKGVMRRLLGAAGLEVRRTGNRDTSTRSGIRASLPAAGDRLGRALVSYIPDDVLAPEDAVSPAHTHYWESRHIARSLAAAGFDVDVVHFADDTFEPGNEYDVLVSARTNLERLARHVPERCVKVAHLDTAHFLTNNANGLRRLLDVRDRHGVTLRSNRMVEENWAVEAADLGCVLGNAFTADSYAYAGKPIHRIPLSSVRRFEWLDDKDFDTCRDTFLWFGSGGFAHKGLDLVIDAFAEMPELRLLICGPVEQEHRFVSAFHRQMYETPNIETIGWVDVTSPDFAALCRRTLATIYPSCSEGGGGCVITCMHAGLIPVVTPEASVDIDDTGIVLPAATIEAIRDAARLLAGKEPGELREMARSAWTLARERHTRETFADHYDRFVADTLVPEVRRRRSSS